MAFTIDEQLSQAIAQQLATCTMANGYAFDILSVYRPRFREDRKVANGVANLEIESYEDGDPETDVLGIKVGRTAVWAIDVFVIPPDSNTVPYDQLRSTGIGEVERCLVAIMGSDGSRPFDGIGHNAELRAPQLLIDPDNGSGGFRVNLAVSYRYVDTDPTQPLN